VLTKRQVAQHRKQIAKQFDEVVHQASQIPGGWQLLQKKIREADVGNEDEEEEEEEDEETAAANAAEREAAEVEAAAQAAREYKSIIHLPTQRKIRKKPVPWSDEEEGLLIGLVSKNGARWAQFEGSHGQPGGPLYPRNQTAMKDKARNIMRAIIDNGGPKAEKEWLTKYPLWRAVSVGSARRGVHAYEGDGAPPPRPWKAAQAQAYEEFDD
jgi:hypothetical protein